MDKMALRADETVLRAGWNGCAGREAVLKSE